MIISNESNSEIRQCSQLKTCGIMIGKGKHHIDVLTFKNPSRQMLSCLKVFDDLLCIVMISSALDI